MPGGLSIITLTIRLPDDKHERLKALAKSNSISINKLMDELATVALATSTPACALKRVQRAANRGTHWRCWTNLIGRVDSHR